MKNNRHWTWAALATAFLAAFALVACGGWNGVTTPSPRDQELTAPSGAVTTLGSQNRDKSGPDSGPADDVVETGETDLPTTPLLEALGDVLDREYFAEVSYQRVLRDFGDVSPFANVALAEGQHAAAIITLYAKRDPGNVPPNPYTVDTVPGATDLVEACKAAVTLEESIYDMYSTLATMKALPTDVSNVVANMMEATFDRHLPAFRQCSAW